MAEPSTELSLTQGAIILLIAGAILAIVDRIGPERWVWMGIPCCHVGDGMLILGSIALFFGLRSRSRVRSNPE